MIVCRFCPVVTFLLIAAVGCGDSPVVPELAPVSGMVTVDGNAVEGLSIMFEPKGAAPSRGVTDSAGSFTLYYNAENPGAVPGTHTVRIMQEPDAEREESAVLKIPKEWNSESLQQVQVASDANLFPFEITTKPAG